MSGLTWETLSAWLAMGGYGLYVWGSLGMCAAVFAGELLSLRAQRRALAKDDSQAQGAAAQTPARRPVLTQQEQDA
ncbi:MAG: heme exporter protein CcmD [Ramlibacter sp.]|jgi:heme exporter protein D|uniref:heme exporter protein CcmD n=1 Tax=Ramlibacter sp. TaxID=1917967 RepID=UPI00260E102B|nr:heme exporter protein CcmD [Ramlibacter sp.]MDH4374982.1 heme exporter protein CcmD [Ramlibacter sp.]